MIAPFLPELAGRIRQDAAKYGLWQLPIKASVDPIQLLSGALPSEQIALEASGVNGYSRSPDTLRGSGSTRGTPHYGRSSLGWYRACKQDIDRPT